MLFQNGKILVRELEEKDIPLLAKWLSDPAVLEFYEGRDNSFDYERVRNVFFKGEEEERKCMVEYEGQEIGYIQFYPLDKETRALYGYREGVVFGIDQFIGEPSYWNQGIGTLLVRSMVQFLVEQENADRVVMDPRAGNSRAIRCYEKCGFTKVKLLPKREFPEGDYHDCWLMEYAASDKEKPINT
ncbi:GNAT family N-acetyltransferase [Peribacillus kribbensis]|uniref:GNAT family N-acetyltransferase n=1 Tax=Peribacillus kribbensis TaxID=356658 RepID=UPI0004252FB6|nr:GNAT family N-acetyltransferase [Peribacillus kribbensis]